MVASVTNEDDYDKYFTSLDLLICVRAYARFSFAVALS